mmetsp:Transcript_22297/g.49025  ORF Transcript_22297/g.49025 Transcript_22297/m.49025 type:complete len:205 (-) Transcript_22297:108-722(-)
MSSSPSEQVVFTVFGSVPWFPFLGVRRADVAGLSLALLDDGTVRLSEPKRVEVSFDDGGNSAFLPPTPPFPAVTGRLAGRNASVSDAFRLFCSSPGPPFAVIAAVTGASCRVSVSVFAGGVCSWSLADRPKRPPTGRSCWLPAPVLVFFRACSNVDRMVSYGIASVEPGVMPMHLRKRTIANKDMRRLCARSQLVKLLVFAAQE